MNPTPLWNQHTISALWDRHTISVE